MCHLTNRKTEPIIVVEGKYTGEGGNDFGNL